MTDTLPEPIARSIEDANAAQAALTQESDALQGTAVAPSSEASVAVEAGLASQQPPSAPPAEDTSIRREDWEQKYRSMQGRYRAELAEAQAQNRILMSQIAQMQSQLDTLLAATKAVEKNEKAKPAPDPKDVENFGADMIEMVQRYAERVFTAMSDQFGAAVKSLSDRVAKLEETVNGVSSRTEATLEQQFYAALASAVPDWEQINADQRWLRWLAEADPVYGVPRQASLDDARARLDVKRVIAIFNEFKRAFAPKPTPSLSNQVAPSGAATAAPAAAADKPIFTQKYVEKFYNDKAKGRISGPAADKIEAEINLAAAEGRIR